MRGAAKRTGAEFVDLFAASDGHDICSDDPWVNGTKTEPGRRWPTTRSPSSSRPSPS